MFLDYSCTVAGSYFVLKVFSVSITKGRVARDSLTLEPAGGVDPGVM